MRHLALLSLLVSASAFAADAPSAAREKAWKEDIFPILEKSCAGCHGKDPAKKAKGGYNIMTLESAAKGGKENGAGITWGNAAKSSSTPSPNSAPPSATKRWPCPRRRPSPSP